MASLLSFTILHCSWQEPIFAYLKNLNHADSDEISSFCSFIEKSGTRRWHCSGFWQCKISSSRLATEEYWKFTFLPISASVFNLLTKKKIQKNYRKENLFLHQRCNQKLDTNIHLQKLQGQDWRKKKIKKEKQTKRFYYGQKLRAPMQIRFLIFWKNQGFLLYEWIILQFLRSKETIMVSNQPPVLSVQWFLLALKEKFYNSTQFVAV